MRKTTNYGLSLYDKEDKLAITSEENSLNANMQIIDKTLKEKATIQDMTDYIEEHKEELKGETGPQGPKGEDGANGKDGKDGYTPIKGVDYFDGKDGVNGADGKDGEQGPKGDKGDTGEQGPAGKDGTSGIVAQAEEPTDEEILVWLDTDEEGSVIDMEVLKQEIKEYVDLQITEAIGGAY